MHTRVRRPEPLTEFHLMDLELDIRKAQKEPQFSHMAYQHGNIPKDELKA
jgi:hypothetical protein